MKTESITKALALGIKFIQNHQKPDGEFKNQNTIFYHALILQSLSGFSTRATNKIIAGISRFLITHKSSRWSFNYWIKPADHPQENRYPDDWDDTACVLAALSLSNNPLPGAALAYAVKNLIAFEKNSGGPYFTWMTTDKAAREVDLVVNANIAYFLSLHQAFPKGLHSFLQGKISKKQFSSPYDVGKFPVLYFLSRASGSENNDKIIKYLCSKLASAKNPQDVALGVCALLNLQFPPKKLKQDIKYLVSRQNNDGSWDTSPFGIEKIINGKKDYSTCSEFTTAVCLEALNKYCQNLGQLEGSAEKQFYSQTVRSFTKTIQAQPKELQNLLLQTLARVLATRVDKQIILLPFWANQMLKPTNQLDRKTLNQLAEANLCGWMAYRVYDDLMDGEGQAKMLPAANWSLLSLSRIYLFLGILDPRLSKLFSLTMDRIEAANAWEQSRKSNPVLAQKSFGAALPALGVLLLGHSPPSSLLYKQTRKFFWHYLFARQLNDDAHDWQTDLERGQVNFAAAIMLKQFKKRPLDIT